MAEIIIIDDDLATELIRDNLRYRGHACRRIGSAADALANVDALLSADLIILDIIMAWPESTEPGKLGGSRCAGMEILREIRARTKEVPVVAYSATQDGSLIEALSHDLHTTFLSKWETRSVRELVDKVHEVLGVEGSPVAPTPFIVHGHDDTLKLELKNFVQNVLGLPEPIILHEQPNQGRTVIEKFEDYAAHCALVFVVLTPDDEMCAPDSPEQSKRRARQNVILEMGYFLGVLGRRSGRVILLHKGPLDIPSDLAGLIYIDVAGGIEAAGEKIRREVENVR